MSKIDAPVLPPPAVQLGDAQAPQITLPTIDRKAAYDCVAKLFDFDTALKLVHTPLGEELRKRLNASFALHNIEMDIVVDEQLDAYGPVLFVKPVDAKDRLRHRDEMSVLRHVESNLETTLLKVRDTMLVRREQQGRETTVYANAILAAGEGGEVAGRAAAASVMKLQEQQATTQKVKAGKQESRVAQKTQETTAELQAANEALRAELSALRLRLEGMTSAAPQTPPVSERRGDSR